MRFGFPSFISYTRELFRGICLDVGELVVVVDRLDIEGGLVRLVGVVEFQLQGIGALVRIDGLRHVDSSAASCCFDCSS